MTAGDHKKEDFRKYLEKNGIIDALTRGLYEEPEKPENPLEYLKTFISGPGSATDAEALRVENEELKRKVEELEKKLQAAGITTGAEQTDVGPNGTSSPPPATPPPAGQPENAAVTAS
ncbi:hypothetical protein HDU85_001092 [Gaertneriomyces sp. JEL0708]|nr:hypothetical protein HDU85_001092 [Gaertneriomyces sp. JEL0708]